MDSPWKGVETSMFLRDIMSRKENKLIGSGQFAVCVSA